jgi:hypothetical protein
MTSKIYKTAQGASVDLGVLRLQNEHVRAVGNMKVNARGDKINNQNQVIETKPQQIQRQNDRVTTNVSSQVVHTSAAKANQVMQESAEQPSDTSNDLVADELVVEDPIVEDIPDIPVNEVLQSAPVAPAVDPVVTTPPTPLRTINTFAPKPKTPLEPTPQIQPPEVNLKNPETPAKSPVADNAQPKKEGLAGAIARTREIKQELDRTRRQQAQDQGVRKI